MTALWYVIIGQTVCQGDGLFDACEINKTNWAKI
jgi:hypothetical protein